jgi:hypothetical protein
MGASGKGLEFMMQFGNANSTSCFGAGVGNTTTGMGASTDCTVGSN